MRIARRVRPVLFVAMFALLSALLSPVMFATVSTNARPVARVTKKVDNSKRTTLYGHVPAVLHKAKDLGRLDPKTPAEHLILVLKSDEQQKREIRRVIDEQQDQRTVNYHQWLTPEEFGTHFGVHDNDIAQVKAWLKSQGFKVESVSKSKRIIHFTGTTGQIENAFQTEMHSFLMPNGETHVSNSRDITVPEALTPVIAGSPTLNNFFRKPHHSPFKKLSEIRTNPNFSNGPNCGLVANSDCFVGPADFATIYNTAPLLASGINGAGVTIGIVGRSDILMSDVQTYRQLFNLPVNDPVFIHAGQDIGIEAGDDGESDLDVEISGGIAPNATVDFVIGTPTFLVDGITNSIEYLVENNAVDIISTSYGDCESNEGAGGNLFNSQMFEQAAAQGISVFIADGDNGPAECDDSNDSYEVLGYAASAEASTPYGVSVGGTMFDEGSGTYWSNTNNPVFQNSAVSYIPEAPWNEAKAASPALAPSGDLSGIWSGSGGISAYYLLPSWQVGPGVPVSDPVLTQGGDWLVVSLATPGSGYVNAPSVTFSGETCASNPVTASTTLSGGQVTAIVYNDGTQGGTLHTGQGFGCTAAGTVTFTAAPAGGTTATGTVALAPMQNMLPVIAGVPHRYTPDVSLNAAAEHDPTVFCSEGVCEIGANGQLADAGLVGGTSVAAPSMAGIQALINQAQGGRQGMPAYIYYSLAAAQNTTNCNSSLPPAAGSNCAFQDVTFGNTLICGTSSCTTTPAKIGFQATPGYDLATGLGSVNAANLSSQWSSVHFNSSTTTLGLSQTTFAHGTPVMLSGTVTGSGTPTGDVAFIVSQGAINEPVNVNTGAINGPVAFATLTGGSYTATLNNLPGGTYNVTARYGGDSTYGSSYSAAIPVTVTAEGSTFTLAASSLNGTACTTTPASSFSYGANILIDAQVTSVSGGGAATGTVTISDNGNPIATAQTLDPNGHAFLLSGPISSSNCLYEYDFANTSTFIAGTHNLTATYSGDASLNSISATPISVSVTQATPTLALAAGATQITSGFNEQLTATFGGLTPISGGSIGSLAPSGTVTFKDTTTSATLGVANVISTGVTTINAQTTAFTAVATLQTNGITASGSNSITATYSGDNNWAPVTSSAVTVAVGTFTSSTSTVVTSNGNPTTLGGRPTFTSTVGVSSGTAPTTGTVTFYDGTNVLGTGSLGSAHTATLRVASGYSLTGGAHNITATYGGVSTTFGPSTSAVFIETVTPGTVTNVLSAKTVGKTGQAYYFTAVITPSSTSTTFQPTANVQFFDGANSLGSASLYSISTGNGGYGLYEANLSVNTLTAGTHTITAQYLGDANYPATTSNSQTVFVGGTPTLAWTTPAAITYGTALSASQLDATDSVPGTYVYSPTAGTLLSAGGHTLSVTFTAADYTDFPTPQTTTVPLQVNQAQTTIAVTVVNPSSEAYGQDGPVAITAVLSWTGSGTAPTASAVNIGGSGLSGSFGTTSCGAPSGDTITCTNTYTPVPADLAGTYTISATFAGDSNYIPSTSPQTGNFSIASATSSTTVSSGLNPSLFGQSVTLTATISGQYGQVKGRDGAGLDRAALKGRPQVVGGTVAWSANTGCNTTPVTAGVATCITSSLAVGSDVITATYSGDSNHSGSSGTLSPNQQVNQASAAASVGSSLNPSVYGQAVSFSANVTAVAPGAGTPTGTVQFVVDGSNFGTPVTLSGGSASSNSTSTLTQGSHTVSAEYLGDTNFLGATGALNGGQTVNQATAATVVTSGLNPSAFGQSVTFTATINGEYGLVKGRRGAVKRGVQPEDVTGTVTWSGNTGCAPSTVTSGNPGTATCTTSILPVGTDTIMATYSGDGNHAGSSGTLSGGQTVNQAATTLAVTNVNPASEGYGQDSQVVITAVLSWTGSGTAPTASAVAISGNAPSNTYGTTSCGAPSGNTITCTNTYTPTAADVPGSYTMSAAFAGDTNYSTSNSAQSNNFSITSGTSSTVVSSGLSPSVFGQSVTLTATISGENGQVKGRNGLGRSLVKGKAQDITGNVQWSSNTGCGTTAVTAGVATCTTSSLAVGTDAVMATYSGDPNHGGSSGTFNQVVNQASANATVGSSLNPSIYGQSVSFSANVTASAPGAGSPTGTVQFVIDGGNFGSPVPLSGGSASSSSISTLTEGNHTIAATYLGDSNFLGVTGTLGGGQVVNPATTGTTVSSNLNPSAYAQPVTFTATINGQYGLVKSRRGEARPPDVNGTVAWSPDTGCGTTPVTSGNPGTATCTTTSLALGTNVITATYSGDSNHTGSAGTLNGGQVVNVAHQTITFTTDAPATAAYNSSFTVVATASSGLPVAFTSAGVCTNSGATYTMTNSTGTCSVIANQSGNADYFPASTVTETTHAIKATQTVTFTGAPASEPYNSSFTVNATSNAPITPSIAATGVCSISGTTVTMTSGMGTCKMTAKWAANNFYNAATATQSTTAEKAASTVTWATPAPISYGTALSATQLDATSNTGGSFVYTPAAGKILNAGTYTLLVTFKPANASDYAGATGSTTLVVNPVATSTAITSNLPNPSATGKPVTVHFTVTPATAYKAPTGSVTVTASTGETCTGTLASGSGSCKLTFSSSGQRTLTANYAGDSNNQSSTSPSVSQTVN